MCSTELGALPAGWASLLPQTIVSIALCDGALRDALPGDDVGWHNITSLAELDLSGNSARGPKTATRKPPRLISSDLMSLDLSGSNISMLPARGLSGLAKLLRLDLSLNPGIAIEEHSFTGLSQLGTLVLAGSALTYVESQWFVGLTELSSLDLSFNRIAWCTLGNSTPALGAVVLHANRLVAIPADLRVGTLEVLDLGANQITTVPKAAFTGCPMLTSIDLSDNCLTLISPGAFTGLAGLAELDLSGNLLGGIAVPIEAFSGLAQTLVSLELANNTLPAVPVDVGGLRSLVNLDLSYNRIETLARGDFRQSEALAVLMVCTRVPPAPQFCVYYRARLVVMPTHMI